MSNHEVANPEVPYQEVKDFLNRVVASQGVLYTRLHQFHWFLKGSHFFSLHEKFEELYDEVTENMDEVAERLITIGGEPYSTLKEYIENSIIEENTEDKYLTQDEMVRATVKDYKTISDSLDEGIKLTDEKGDDVSNDMLIAIKADMDQTIWMLQAFLGNSPQDEI